MFTQYIQYSSLLADLSAPLLGSEAAPPAAVANSLWGDICILCRHPVFLYSSLGYCPVQGAFGVYSYFGPQVFASSASYNTFFFFFFYLLLLLVTFSSSCNFFFFFGIAWCQHTVVLLTYRQVLLVSLHARLVACEQTRRRRRDHTFRRAFYCASYITCTACFLYTHCTGAVTRDQPNKV